MFLLYTEAPQGLRRHTVPGCGVLAPRCGQRRFKHLVHGVHGDEVQSGPDRLVDLLQILDIVPGMMTVCTPLRRAAMVFSFRPPMASTRPRRVTSPVMATLPRTGRPDSADSMAVVMAMPADGPSLGTAPSGKWTWMSLVL